MKAAALLLLATPWLYAAEEHAARGIVLKTEVSQHALVVSCEAIPGYMDAMEMEFAVREAKMLAGLKPGTAVNFRIATRGNEIYAEDIRVGTTASFEAEPMAAGQLSALNNALDPTAKSLAIGERVPDFALTNQAGNTVHLAQFEGKTVALTFGYSRCPNPNYCFRLSNNLAQAAKRLPAKAGQNLILMTIMIDPEHDQGAALTAYAKVWKAEPPAWNFLTGPRAEIKDLAGMFGMNFWSVEGLVTHSLHTVIIDRRGRLAVNLEGNQFTPQELTDLVRTVIDRR